MELPRYDLPTLHRPVSLEDNVRAGNYGDMAKVVHPIATPPHKQNSLAYYRPHSGTLLCRRQRVSSGSTLPSLMTETQWRTRRAKQQSTDNLPDSEEFEESYNDLATKTAYRYPHPGAPKGREGCMGGTWRHTKEAIGYGPGRLMWIDGVVTLYDDWAINHEKPWSGTPLSERPTFNRLSHKCHPNRDSLPNQLFMPIKSNQPQVPTSASRWYSSNVPQPLPVSNIPCGGPKAGEKYKGFYSMAQTYS